MKSKGKSIGKSAIVVVTMSALLVASYPAFAAEESTKTATVVVKQASTEAGDQVVAELFNEDNNTKAEYGCSVPDEGEGVDLSEYEEKVDYGDLTDEEIKELNKCYDRMAEIGEEIYGADFEKDEAAVEAGIKKYEKEMEQLEERVTELEKKAGWYSDEYAMVSEDPEVVIKDLEKLTGEDLGEMRKIYDKAEEIGLISIITDDKTTEKDFEEFIKNHEAELAELDEAAEGLERKILGE